MKPIVIAPDSFKGSLSAPEAAHWIAQGLKNSLPDVPLLQCPMADGGEGSLDVWVRATQGQIRTTEVLDPLLRPIQARYGISGDGKRGFVEMAEASGLTRLAPEERNPWVASSIGTGQLILAVLNDGCTEIMMAIGGSAVNDGGVGMARALGARFLDSCGSEIPEGGGALGTLVEIDTLTLDARLSKTVIRVACDVSNPLWGNDGASVVYGPQKGADPAMVLALDNNLKHYGTLLDQQVGAVVSKLPGSGAAGGMGATLKGLLKAELAPGASWMMDYVGLPDALKEAGLCITGEGRIDSQTAYGKVPAAVAQEAARWGVFTIALGGDVLPGASIGVPERMGVVIPISEGPESLETAMATTGEKLLRAGERIGALIRLGKTLV